MQKVLAYLHSKKVNEKQGDKEEVEIVGKNDNFGTVTYIVKTQSGIKCTAIYNPFSCAYYADDIYGIIREGGAMKKQTIKFCRTDSTGNIFDITGRVSAELKKAGKNAEAKNMAERIWQAESYDDALKIINEYVDLVEVK